MCMCIHMHIYIYIYIYTCFFLGGREPDSLATIRQSPQARCNPKPVASGCLACDLQKKADECEHTP